MTFMPRVSTPARRPAYLRSVKRRSRSWYSDSGEEKPDWDFDPVFPDRDCGESSVRLRIASRPVHPQGNPDPPPSSAHESRRET